MMIPESRSDQTCAGYGGPARMSSNGVSPSNNAMEIFSRFRPIAPKPTTPKPGESAGSGLSDPPSSSTLSFERTSGGKAVSSEKPRTKRSRKVIGSEPLLPPTRRTKRGPTPSRPRAVCKGPPAVGGIQKAVEQFAPEQSRLQPMVPISKGVEYRPVKGGTSNLSPQVAEVAPPDYVSMGEAPEAHAGWVRPDRRKYSNGFGAFKMPPSNNDWLSSRGSGLQDAGAAPANDALVAEEPSFMGRAAGASNSQPFFGREVHGVQKLKGGYERGFENYPKCGSSDEYHDRAIPVRALDFMRNSSPYATYGPENEWTNDQTSCAPSKGESEVISDGNSREPELVTLSLLPDTPSQSGSSPVPIKPTTSPFLPCLELTMVTDSRDWKETKSDASEDLHKLSLFNSGYEEERRNAFSGTDRDRSQGTTSSSDKGLRASRILEEPAGRIPRVSASSRDSDDSGVSVSNITRMERLYSASSDPMMLSDDLSGEILWANTAYMKADAERNQRLGKAKEAGAPYLDVLGVPTKLSSFEFQTSEGMRTKANLWGFLKKFMTSEPSRVNSVPDGSIADEGSGSKETRTPEQRSKSSSATEEDFPGSLQINRPKLITPQPIRPVGSTLTFERITSMDLYALPITDNLEHVKEELETKPTPSVITDHKNRVNWVNTAYKQMVGQPECSWLASTMGLNTTKDVPQQSRLIGEVMLMCDEQLSKFAHQFSCKVNIRWTNEGDENFVTLPADVSRIENDKRAVMYVWKLDPWSPARLQNGARRINDSRHSPQSHSPCQ